MIELLYDLLGWAYWLAIIAVVVWWVNGMRKAAKPRPRTPQEEAELASVRRALAGEHATPAQAPAAVSGEPGN